MNMNLRPNLTRYKRQIMTKLCSCGAIHDLSQILQHRHDQVPDPRVRVRACFFWTVQFGVCTKEVVFR
jgi:hypothetical protein